MSFTGTSTYGGYDIFGSGPHIVEVGGLAIDNIQSGFAGADGVQDTILGTRGRPVAVRGRLLAASYAALQTLMATIEDACTWDESALVYLSYTYNYVVLRTPQFGPVRQVWYNGATTYTCEYTINGRQIYT